MNKNRKPSAVISNQRPNSDGRTATSIDLHSTALRCVRQLVWNDRGKVIGEVQGDTYVKKVRESKHMHRNPRGWAIDLNALLKIEQMGVENVEIIDTESGKLYRCKLETFWERGQMLDKGYGKQMLLLLNAFRVTETKRTEPPFGPPPMSKLELSSQLPLPGLEQ
jgi:hypothetical protein